MTQNRDKWQMTEAARKRIEKKITDQMMKDRNDAIEFRMVHDIELLCEQENFARPRAQAIELIANWIREGKFKHLCAYIFERECRRADDHAKAGGDLLEAIGSLARARGDDRQRRRKAREELAG